MYTWVCPRVRIPEEGLKTMYSAVVQREMTMRIRDARNEWVYSLNGLRPSIIDRLNAQPEWVVYVPGTPAE